jgi:hypothetical protein
LVRFYKALDIFVPEDYDEPDHFVDRLPQPYRRIMKVRRPATHACMGGSVGSVV